MPNQITNWLVVGAVYSILFMTLGFSLYLFFIRMKGYGKFETSAAMALVAGVGGFLVGLVVSWMKSDRNIQLLEFLTIPIILGLGMAALMFIGIYIQLLGNEFWEKRANRKSKRK
jgi:hypothetical protein